MDGPIERDPIHGFDFVHENISAFTPFKGEDSFSHYRVVLKVLYEQNIRRPHAQNRQADPAQNERGSCSMKTAHCNKLAGRGLHPTTLL